MTPAEPDLPKNPRILIIRQDRLGDCLLATPVPIAIKQRHPSAFVGVMCKPEHQTIFDRIPEVDTTIPCGRHFRGLQIARTARGFRKGRWDAVLILMKSSRGLNFASWLAGIPTRVGRTSAWHGRLLTHNYIEESMAWRNEVVNNALLAQPLGISCTGLPELSFEPAPEEVEAARKHTEGRTGYVVCAPGTGGTAGPWGVDRYAELLKGQDVIWTGAPHQHPGHELPGLDLIGKLSLGELAAITRDASLSISGNTAALHVAAAVGTATLVIQTHIRHESHACRFGAWRAPTISVPRIDGEIATVGQARPYLERALAASSLCDSRTESNICCSSSNEQTRDSLALNWPALRQPLM